MSVIVNQQGGPPVTLAEAADAPSTHAHAQGDVTGLVSALAGKAASSHTHSTSEVTGLDAALAAKSDVGHTHPGGSEAFPVGSIHISDNSANPATTLGYGTWVAVGAGRVLVGFDAADTDFDTDLETGGAKTVTLTEAQIPSHTHVQNSHNHTQDAHNHTQNSHTHVITSQTATSGSATSYEHGALDTSSAEAEATEVTGATTATNIAATATNQAVIATNQSTGGGQAHSNLQPYLVVRFWRRTA